MLQSITCSYYSIFSFGAIFKINTLLSGFQNTLPQLRAEAIGLVGVRDGPGTGLERRRA